MILECVATGVAGLFVGFIVGRFKRGELYQKKKEVHFPSLIISPVEKEYPYIQRSETTTNPPVPHCDVVFPSVPIQPLPVPKSTPDPIVFSEQNI